MIVVDASLIVAWLLNESVQQHEDDVLQLLTTQTALVPAHWPNEVANALRRAVRMKRIAIDEIAPIVDALSTFDIKLADPPGINHIAGLSQQALASDVSVYDLQYLRLAEANHVALATMDAGMRKAAGALNIALLPA